MGWAEDGVDGVDVEGGVVGELGGVFVGGGILLVAVVLAGDCAEGLVEGEELVWREVVEAEGGDG